MYPKQAKEDMSGDFFLLWSHVSLPTLPWRIRSRRRHRHPNHRYCMVLACGHAALLGMWRGEHLGGPWGSWKQIRSNQGSFGKEVCTKRLKKNITRDDVRKSSVIGFVYISYRYTMNYSSSNTDSKVQCSVNLPTSLHEFDWFSSSFCRSSYWICHLFKILRMASSIASPAMLGRSYASAVQIPKLRNFGDLTLVKKPGNGQWRWLAQRVLFGAYQVSWWSREVWFRW